MQFSEIKSRLAKLDTACICDANKEVRSMSPDIRPLNSGNKLIGRARTVTCKDDFLTVLAALRDSVADEVLVVDGQGGIKALAGELFSTEAERRGLAGIVIDGGFRDARTVKQLKMPVYARHLNPMAGTTKTLFATQITITCGGVKVEPGDIIFGDEDGLIVASESELIELIPAAEALQTKEEAVLKRMQEGTSLMDMLNFSDHYRKIQENETSKLTFTQV